MFQIHPLPAGEFSYLNGLSDTELAARNIQVHVSDGKYPCRVSLADAPEGERVFLLNFEHLPCETPYRSRHAIFVRERAQESHPEPGEVPAALSSRLLSVRAFNARHEMVDADVVDGMQVAGLVSRFFGNPDVDYIHLHYARRGCYAARVTRPA
ncbi:DUF1203 domain-containing protein [Roseibium aggregatum]|uniref:DUF1203 domain-containing protein n=1 Tax=Roseibium aggregatum TaxID=187304 RepID=A0A939EI09_9HYPH|nr:DUF1203 domain-containing protein [Roseibium aggregatum]MBN9673056.1 DUF1203 domain-containing protein [Roseibium aggregatum]